MSTEVSKISIDVPEGLQPDRAGAWLGMGLSVQKTEMQLQAIAQKALNDVVLPVKFEEVTKAESKLIEIKKSKTECEELRKKITGTLDKLSKRLMEPEKSFEPKISELTSAIIKVKKDEEVRLSNVRKADEERARVKEIVLNLITNKDYEFKSFIDGRVSLALQYALSDGNISPDKLEEYIDICSKKYDEKKFALVFPGYSPTSITSAEVSDIVAANFKWDANFYVNLYREELKKKFVDYHVAFANKQAAIEAAQKEEADKQKALAEEKENKELSAKLEANAVPLETMQVTSNVRQLKKSYEVDMPETFDSAMAILAAMIANKEKCLTKLKVNKWFAFTPAQAATALSKVKCDDNNFAPAGINFKEVAKL
jgi:hypothetical protein